MSLLLRTTSPLRVKGWSLRLLFASEVWGDSLSDGHWGSLEATVARNAKAAGGLAHPSSNVDAVREMGLRPLRHLAGEKAIRRSALVSTYPDGPATVLDSPHFPSWKRSVGCIPTSIPDVPPAIGVDRIVILASTPPCGAGVTASSPAPVRLAVNVAQQARMMTHAAPNSHIFEAWSDASVMQGTDGPRAGAAAMVWGPGDTPMSLNDAPLSLSEISGPGTNPCSYSAEVLGGIRLLEDTYTAVSAWKATHPTDRCSVLLSVDSQSWLSHVARGPTFGGTLCVTLWKAFTRLTLLADRVVAGFKFAHCGDPKGDLIDAAAATAREANIPPTAPWHVDEARPLWQALRNRTDAEVNSSASSFVRGAAPDGLAVDISRLPAASLPRAMARNVLRLRTGVWAPLGPGTYLHGTAPTPCRQCGLPLAAGEGTAVHHLFHCAACPSTWTVDDLWSKSADTLKSIVEHCMQFAALPLPAATAPTTG